jgi:DNA-binding winged helix-turn-helix (wHTH) protein/tetratricopeptide (TPR) repeat protein
VYVRNRHPAGHGVATKQGIYRFDRFRLDPWRGVLARDDGTELHLRPKAFALLKLMLDHPGRLFGREELLEGLWPGVIVTDDSLTQCVGDLRQALGDRAAEILRTVPRRGYRLAADVMCELAEPAAAAAPAAPPPVAREAARQARRDALQLQALRIPPGDTAAARFAQALMFELMAELVRCDGLRVVAGAEAPLAECYRLVGEVRSTPTELRVLLQLEDVRSGTVFWAERLVELLEHASDPPGSTVVPLAVAIDLQIDRKSLRRARATPAEALTARELCLLGRDQHQHGTEAATIAARELFARSGVLDPGYAAAHAWHAFTLMRVITYGWDAQALHEAREEALRLSRLAVELEPDSALCLSALAFALSLSERWEEAVETAHVALRAGRMAPGTRTACGEVLAAGGHPLEAVRLLREAIALDPHAPPRPHAILGRALLLAGEPEEALKALRRCAARLSDYAPCFRTMVVAAYEAGAIDEARMALRQVARMQPNWIPGEQPIFWFLRHPADIERFQTAFHAVRRLDMATRSGRLLKPDTTRS